MKQFKKVISTGLSFVMIAMLASSCGPSNTAKDNPSGGKDSGDANGSTSGSFTYWMHNGPAFLDVTNKIVDSYQKENPGVKIDLQNFPYDVIMQKMQASYAAKNEPELTQGFGAWMLPYMKNGLLAEVPEQMTANAKDKWFEAAIGGYEYEGKYYGIPREVNVEYGVFYDTNSLKATGKNEIPATFDDFYEVAKAMTEKDGNGNITKSGFDFYNYDGTTFLLLDWIVQQGGDYFAEDGLHIKLNTPEGIKAMEMFVKLASGDDAVCNIKRITTEQNIEQIFFSGLGSSVMKGPWANALAAEYDTTDYAYAVLPPFAGNDPKFVCEPGWGEVVSERAKNKDLVWKFVEYATNVENSTLFNVATGTIPALIEVAESDAILNNESLAVVKDAFGMMEHSMPIGTILDSDKLKSSILKYTERAINGELTAEEALKQAEEEINKQFDTLLAQ